MSHRLSRLAPWSPTLMLCLLCAAIVQCVQLEDGPTGGAAKTWSTAEPVADDGRAPLVAIDSGTNVVVVWTQTGGLWSRDHARDGDWGSSTRINSGEISALDTATVAMDPLGNALAVWSQDFADRIIYANRRAPNGAWSNMRSISANGVDAFEPSLSISAVGTAMAVWFQEGSVRDDVWSNRYVPDNGGWGDPTPVETGNALRVEGPRVAVASNGIAVAVWAHSDSGVSDRFDIWSNRYTPDRGWGSETTIETHNAGDALRPQVGVDDAGNAFAVWTQFNGATFDVWSNRYASSTGWGQEQVLETDDGGDAVDPQLAVDGNGNAVVVWAQSDGAANDIWSNRYSSGGGWGRAERIDAIDAGFAQEPQIAIDQSGVAVAVWRQFDGSGDHIWSNLSTLSGGWGTAQRVDPDNKGNLGGARVVMSPSGDAAAVWRVFGASNTGIWLSRLE